jgi:hypothetical protein
VLLPVAAFRLDLGAEATNEPVQLRIPVQVGAETATPGEEVLFFRKGQVLQPDGQWHDTWWLLDNGVIEADASGQLVARTASRPYEGMTRSGDYMISRRSPGMMDTIAFMNIEAGTWASFGGLGFSMGGGLGGFSAFSSVLGALATQAIGLVAGRYAFGVPTFAEIELPRSESNSTLRVDTRSVLPSAPSPFGIVSLPNISNAVVNQNGQIVFTVPAAAPNPNPSAGTTTGQLVVRAVLGNGRYRDVVTLPGSTTGEIVVSAPDDLAIGSVGWQLVRLIPTDTVGADGEPIRGEPLEFAGNRVWLDPIPGMAAVLTRTGITIVRQEKDPATVPLLELVKSPGEGQSDFGAYLTGRKVQPVAFSPDLSRIYVGGNGAIYVIDTLRLKRIGTILIPGGGSITSMAKAGNLLIIGEGGNGGNGGSLRFMIMDPASSRFHEVASIQGTGIEASQFGVSDISIGPDGKTMVVALPGQNPSIGLAGSSIRGDVLIFDMASLDTATGRIDAPIRAGLPDGISGKAPHIVTATDDADRYLVANVNDYDRGLATLVISRDGDGRPTRAAMNALHLNQPNDQLRRDRLDIQRAQSAVLITDSDGTEYAIVADDNYNFNDPYWRAMFEAPMFVQTSPFGPPTAVGGGASARKVNVGGKLGIVKDPFGLRGTPQYLGATVPLDGYGIINLSVSDDGKTLIGQLKGGYGTIDQLNQLPHESQVWDVDALLAAAVAQPETDRLAKPIILPTNAGQRIPTNGYAPAGTEFEKQAMITLIDPTDASGQSNSRPVFRLVSNKDLKELRIFLSTFPPGEGLFPDDRPKHIASGWINSNIPEALGEHQERIYSSKNLLSTGQILRAGEIYPFDEFANQDAFSGFRLTPGQSYWWGAEGKIVQGGEVSASASTPFTVKTALEQGLITPASQVTIITHGFQPPLPFADMDPAKTGSAELARMIAGTQEGLAYKYLRSSGKWVPLDGNGPSLSEALFNGKAVILVPDWIKESGFSDSGFSEAAADAIYASLVQADAESGGRLLRGYLHLIAHSRGTVVNSELSQRLLWYSQRQGVARPLDLQITTLDPHDQRQDSLILEGSVRRGLSVLGDFTIPQVQDIPLGLNRIDYSEFYDPDVQAWQGVDYADNYYQHIARETLPSVTVTPNGRSLAGADDRYGDNGFDFDLDLSGLKGFIEDDKVMALPLSRAIAHSRPQSWYAGTIDLSLDYFSPKRTIGGDPEGDRDPIIRRQADYAADRESLGGSKSPYTYQVLPWYLNRPDLALGRVIRGDANTPGLFEARHTEPGAPTKSWEGIGIGWAMSAQGGGLGNRTQAGITQRIPISFDNTEFGKTDIAIPTIFNGDFQASVRPFFGRFPTSYELPGWAYHNGNQADGADQTQARNLAFKGFDQQRLSAVASANDRETFDTLLGVVKSLKNDNFTIDDLETFATILNVLRVGSWLVPKGALAKSALGKIIAKHGLKALRKITALGVEEFAKFGLLLGQVADWAYQLDGASAPLRHNRMVLPSSASGLSFEVATFELPATTSTPEDPNPTPWLSTAVLVVELLSDDQQVPTILGRFPLLSLPIGFSQQYLVIPQQLRANPLQSAQIQFRLEDSTFERVLIDSIRFGSSVSIIDSSEARADQTILFSDSSQHEPNLQRIEAMERIERMDLPGQNEHFLTLKNLSSDALQFSVSIEANDFVYLGRGQQRTSAHHNRPELAEIQSLQHLGADSQADIDLSVGMDDTLRKRLGDQYDALLLSTSLLVDTRRFTSTGSSLSAGSQSVRLVYFTELSDLNGIDGIIHGRDIVAGQARAIRIYNPDHIEIKLSTGSRWRLSREGDASILTLSTRAADQGVIDESFQIILNGQVYRNLVARVNVRPRQQLLIDAEEFDRNIAYAVETALTPADQLENFSPSQRRLRDLLAGPAFRAAFPEDFGSADRQAIAAGMRRAAGSTENLGIFCPAFWSSSLDVSFASLSSLSTAERDRTNPISFDLESFGNSLEAGQASWDFQQNMLAPLLLQASGMPRADLGSRAQAYALGRLLNQSLTGAAFSGTSASGNGQARISIPNALAQAVASTGDIADRNARMTAIGTYFGWLIAHELAHNLGLPDEYTLAPDGQRLPLVGTPSFMGAPNQKLISRQQRDLLYLALRHPLELPPERLDVLLRYILQLGNQRPFQGSPPLSGDEISEVVDALSATGEDLTRSASSDASADSSTNLITLLQNMGVINPTLLNPDFGIDGTDSWVSEGDLQPGTNAITLKESTTAPTHLAQIFQINPGNRQLRFTVSNLSLNSNASGPNDAFEVALLDADTTLPALGASGTVPLANSDALLNLQSSGSVFLAPALQWSDNGDGSFTYSLDLPDSLAGTAVLLSFDLIGFGAADSQVTLRDISLDGSQLATPTPSVVLVNDTGSSASDRLTADGTVSVSGLASGATWQFSTDGGSSWSAAQTAATTTSFVLPSGSYGLGQVRVRQSLGGSSSASFTSFEALTVDTTAPLAPVLTLANDTGYSSSDRLTADGSLSIGGVEANAVWQVSTDGGTTWSADPSPATSSFLLAPGSYGAGQVQLRQRDAAGNSSAPLSSFAALVVDTTAPTGALTAPGATPVAPLRSTTPAGTYGSGAAITLTLEFSEAVRVDTTGGVPSLQLETGAVDRFASYSGGSGTTTLSFSYIVQDGDRSADLDQLSSSALALNGATLQDGAGNNALLSLAAPGAPGSLAANANLVIDAVNDAPTDLVLSNVIASLPETTSTSAALKVAEITISDDEFGTNILSLSGADANRFEIVANALYLKAGTALNYEGSQNTYDLTLAVADASVEGSTPITKPYSLQISNVNEAPNGLLLSTTNFDENIPINTLISTLAATDPDLPYTPQKFTYALTSNYGDNLIFYIQDNGLYISASPYYADYERFNSFAIRLKVNDQEGLSFQRDLKLFVNDLPDTPTYSVSQSASSILEGQSVSFGLVTTNVAVHTPIYWSISGTGTNGTGITGSDFSDGQLSGSGSLGADGRFSLLRTTVSDAQSDPDESFSLSFFDDAARTHRLADPLVVQIKEPNVGSPSDGADNITGTDAAETITGVPVGSVLYGRGSIDQLTGKGGNDIFVLGTASQRYYDLDGTTGMAVIKDFSIGQDKIQLHGMANQYSFSSGRLNNITGTFISVASSGDRIGFIEGLRSTGVNPLNLNDFSQFRYVVAG